MAGYAGIGEAEGLRQLLVAQVGEAALAGTDATDHRLVALLGRLDQLRMERLTHRPLGPMLLGASNKLGPRSLQAIALRGLVVNPPGH